jgi:hypothetical protein
MPDNKYIYHFPHNLLVIFSFLIQALAICAKNNSHYRTYGELSDCCFFFYIFWLHKLMVFLTCGTTSTSFFYWIALPTCQLQVKMFPPRLFFTARCSHCKTNTRGHSQSSTIQLPKSNSRLENVKSASDRSLYVFFMQNGFAPAQSVRQPAKWREREGNINIPNM